MTLFRCLASTLCLAATLGAQAAPLHFQAGGTWADTAPVTLLTAPGATWSISFVVDSDPTPEPSPMTEPGLFTTVPFTQYSFMLDGVAVAAQPFWVSLYNAGNGGGIDIFYTDVLNVPSTDPVTALSLYTVQLYTGTEDAPTVQPGVYATSFPGAGDGVKVAADGLFYDLGETTLTISAVPLPGTLPLALLGALALRARARRPAQPA